MREAAAISDSARLMAQGAEFEHFIHTLLAGRTPLGMSPIAVWHPPTDVYETPDEIIVKMEIPGIRVKDVQLVLSKNTLTVRGRAPESETKVCFHQMEITYGPFERTIVVGERVDPDATMATYSDGFLRIVVPKAPAPEVELPKVVVIKIRY